MTIRRQLVNFGSTCTDFRLGSGLLDELPRILKNVVGSPKRAHAIVSPGTDARVREAVRRALADAGFSITLTESDDPSMDAALAAMRDLSSAGITSDDLILGVGQAAACSLAIWCSRSWCAGTACVLVPTSLDGMASLATGMAPLSCGEVPGCVSIQPHVDMVACDLDLVAGGDVERLGLGYTVIVRSALSESRRVWDKLAENIDRMLEGDPIALIDLLCMCQTSRSGSIKSSSPSARSALAFGLTTAAALKGLMGPRPPGICASQRACASKRASPTMRSGSTPRSSSTRTMPSRRSASASSRSTSSPAILSGRSAPSGSAARTASCCRCPSFPARSGSPRSTMMCSSAMPPHSSLPAGRD